jgi:DNA-binding winged helix-turn-helix (wHTH) protein
MTEETYSNRKEDTFLMLQKDNIVESGWTPRFRVVHEVGTARHYAAVQRLRRHVLRGGEKSFFWVTVDRRGMDREEDVAQLRDVIESVIESRVDIERRVMEVGEREAKEKSNGIMGAIRSVLGLAVL